MEFSTKDVKINGMGEGPTCRVTFRGNGSDQVVLDLTPTQVDLLNARFIRSFMIRCRKERIFDEIENATDGDALELVARRYGLCDTCEFSDLDLYGVKRLLMVVVELLYKYPRLRSRFCYIGSHAGFKAKVDRLRMGDAAMLREFALHYICDRETTKALGALAYNAMEALMSAHDSYIATAVSMFGLFDAVLLDQNDYSGYAYVQMLSDLRRNERKGFHPQGCASPESVVYHEIGHMLDYLCGLSANAELQTYVATLSKTDVLLGLSEYATVSTQELIAEAFAEYMCNPTPRKIARFIGGFIDTEYMKIPK
jgi:hypothetical protein